MTDRRTPLFDDHEAAGASFTDFNGWKMPVAFDSIRVEHESVREAVGAFDVSHMGQVAVTGPDAGELCQRLTTNDVDALAPGEAQYSTITDEDGVVLDDTVVYRLPDGAVAGVDPAVAPDADYLFVPNAGNDEAMTQRWIAHRDEWGLDAAVENATTAYAMLAVQGPEAEDALVDTVDGGAGRPAATDAVTGLAPFEAVHAPVAGTSALISRTGYTGEDGFEVTCPAADASAVWSAIEAQPCGLGARDTLRLEMGFLLSGQDFHPAENPRNPYEADVASTVDLDTDFVGRDALAAVVEAGGPAERIVGLRLEERGVPRHGYDIRDGEGTAIGTVTSGTMSPTLGEPIGLCYVPVDFAEPGTTVAVVVRGDPKTATIVEPPFIGGR
ncbi:MAG: glycine cleavage system aminomethyltransferase GcvT [Halobacteriaceae archaeon]